MPKMFLQVIAKSTTSKKDADFLNFLSDNLDGALLESEETFWYVLERINDRAHELNMKYHKQKRIDIKHAVPAGGPWSINCGMCVIACSFVTREIGGTEV